MAAERRKRSKHRFLVCLDGKEIGFWEAATVQGCIRALELEYCIGRTRDPRRYCPGSAPHGHVPGDRIDRERRTVQIGPLGTFPYPRDQRLPVSPAVTFRTALLPEAPPVA